MTCNVAPCVIAVLLALVVFSRVVVKDEPVLTTPSNDDTDVECTIKSSGHLNELQLLDAEKASLVFVSWDYAKKACKKDKSVTCQSHCRQNQDGTIALELDLAVVGEKESRTINCSAHFFEDGQSWVVSRSLTVSGRSKGEPRKNTCDESYEDGRKDGVNSTLKWALPVIVLPIVLLIALVLLYMGVQRKNPELGTLASSDVESYTHLTRNENIDNNASNANRRGMTLYFKTGTTDNNDLGTESSSPLVQSKCTQSTPNKSVQVTGPTDTNSSGCAERGCSAHVEEVPAPGTPDTVHISRLKRRMFHCTWPLAYWSLAWRCCGVSSGLFRGRREGKSAARRRLLM
ncbi:hypothetical protein BaRGS_00028527, partial [Batillaria attramentaria]